MKTPDRLLPWKQDYVLRSLLSSAVTSLTTAAFFLYNLWVGVHYSAIWNYSISFYYLLLVILRSWVLFSEKRWRHCAQNVRQQKRAKLFRRVSKMLILVDLILSVPISLMVLSQRTVTMGKIPAISIAAYTCYKVTISLIHYGKSKKNENRSVHILRIIGLKDAMVSVLTLQNTMVMVFHTGKSMQTLTAYTSAGILLLMIAFTVVLIRRDRTTFPAG